MSTFCGAHGIGRNAATGMLGSVLTALASDPEFARRFREAFIAPKVQVAREIYQRAIERGEIPDTVDVDVIAPRWPASCSIARSCWASSPTTRRSSA